MQPVKATLHNILAGDPEHEAHGEVSIWRSEPPHEIAGLNPIRRIVMENFFMAVGCILFLVVSMVGSFYAMHKIGQLWTWWIWHHPDLSFAEFCAAEAALSREKCKEIEDRLDQERRWKIHRVKRMHKKLKEQGCGNIEG